MSLRSASLAVCALLPLALAARPAAGQIAPAPADSAARWAGQRILMLTGFGEVHRSADDSSATSSVGINLVGVVARAEGRRLWIRSTSGGDSGWVDSSHVVLLAQALPYLDTLIGRDSESWDLYLRRAEAEHALNRRDAATADYTAAIRLHPSEAFLYLRRGRHYGTVHQCAAELSDFQRGIELAPTSAPQGYNLPAELYSLESGVYSSCPDSTLRDTVKAIVAIQHAIALDSTRPTFLVILAGAYASAGRLRDAVTTLRRALRRADAAPSYREDWEQQLHEYERALAGEKRGRS